MVLTGGVSNIEGGKRGYYPTMSPSRGQGEGGIFLSRIDLSRENVSSSFCVLG